MECTLYSTKDIERNTPAVAELSLYHVEATCATYFKLGVRINFLRVNNET